MTTGVGSRRGWLAAGLLVCALLVVGCSDLTFGGGNESPALPSGIRGTVLLGPTCPVEREDMPPCVTPYAATLAILNSENAVVTRVNSGPDGRFEVSLPPGDYVIAPESGDPYPIAQPLSVTVTPGQYEEVEINYDTGIR
jgi:hypothetical protein